MMTDLIIDVFFLVQQGPDFIWVSMEASLYKGWLKYKHEQK